MTPLKAKILRIKVGETNIREITDVCLQLLDRITALELEARKGPPKENEFTFPDIAILPPKFRGTNSLGPCGRPSPPPSITRPY